MNLDDLLRENASLAREAMLDSLPAPEDCGHAFSPRFVRRMRPLLRRQAHPAVYQMARRAAALFLAALLGGGAWMTADTSARAAFFQWVREVYETQIVYRFAGDQMEESGIYRPAWVPEGYVELDASDRSVIYYNEELDQTVGFQYVPMQEGVSLFIEDADKATITSVEINGISGELYRSTDSSLTSALLWLDEDIDMAFSIFGFLEKSDMLYMAESLYLVDSTN